MGYTVSSIDARHDGNRVAKVQSLYERMREQWASFRSASLKSYEYVVGNQLDDDVREKLRKEQRPAMVFNLMQPKIVTIAGLLESNKMFLKAVPIGEGDEQMADVHTQLVSDFAMRNCNGVKEVTKAALDAAIGKIGWLNNYWSTKEDMQGKWYTESYDPFMVLFDPDGRRQDQKDWRYLAVTGFYTADEIIAMCGDKIDEEKIIKIREADERISGLKKSNTPTSWIERVWSGVSDTFERARGKKSTTYEGGTINDYCDTRVGRYRVIEFHDRRTKVRSIFYNAQTRETQEMPDGEDNSPGQEQIKSEEQLQTLNKMTGGGWIKRTVVTQELWITACAPWLLTSEMLYEMPYPVQNRGFQFKPIFCYDFHPDITKMQSLIEILIDPQDSYNQRRMTFLEWLMNAVNPDWTAPQGSIDGGDLPVWQSKTRGKIKFFKLIMGQKPEPQHPLIEGQALKTFSDEDRDLAETLTNVTPNTQGQSEGGQQESGVLFAQKVQRALTALSYFFGNVQLAMTETFNYADGNLQAFMDAPRKVRLLSPQNDPTWIAVNWPTIEGKLNDLSAGEYDFQADTVQLGETAKQVKFAEALAFIRSIPPELVKWDEIFQLWDSPVSEVMGQFAAQMMGIALQAQQAQQEMAQQKAQIDQVGAGAQAVGALEQVAGTDPKTRMAQQQAQVAAAQKDKELGMKGREMMSKGSA